MVTGENPCKYLIAGCPETVKRGSKSVGSIPTDDIVDAYENDKTNIGENEKVEDVMAQLEKGGTDQQKEEIKYPCQSGGCGYQYQRINGCSVAQKNESHKIFKV